MIFKILIYYLIGYLRIEVDGVFVERFINICKARQILLWNIKLKEEIKLYANIGIKDYKKIREIAKKTNTKVIIKKKKGVPFIINKYKKRKALVTILAIVILVNIVLSNFIWNITITGNTNISTDEIIEELKQEGLEIGTLKNNINLNMVINNLRLKNDDIAWVGINIKGTNARIKIKERNKAPAIIDDSDYCNIVSDKDGLIIKIDVQNGTAVVKPGDIVKKGDLLVNGYLEGKYTGIRYVHAISNIRAKVWYSKKEKKYFKQQILTDTGKTEKKYALKINNFKINFYKTLSKFENYDTICESKKMKIFSNFYLPIEIIKMTNKEKKEESIIYTEEELSRENY